MPTPYAANYDSGEKRVAYPLGYHPGQANQSLKYVRSEIGGGDFAEDELRVYFGPNADYYIAAWQAETSRDGRKRINWAAFFFSTPWLLRAL
jgi:hypothetical protein